MKKMICCFLTIVMLLSSIGTVSATTLTETSDVLVATNDYSIAYLSTEGVDTETYNAIIAARNDIIFSRSWVAEGHTAYVVDKDGNIIDTVPCFYDVFPSDWSMPTYQPSQAVPAQNARDLTPVQTVHVTLNRPSDEIDTEPFYTFDTGWPYTNYNHIEVEGYHYEGYYNIGFSDADTGDSYGYLVNLESGQAVFLEVDYGTVVDIRASTYTSPGEWTFWISGDRV